MSKIIRLIDRTRTVQNDWWLDSILGKEADERFSQRFWSKVERGEPNDCWNWKAFINPKGYGQFQVKKNRPAHAHKVALALVAGVKIGSLVCHKCDNRRCCNPRHLYEGTPKSNMDDMISKGRSNHPSMKDKIWCATLTHADVRYIRRWYGKTPTKEIASYLGCSKDQIYQVASGRTWKHVK
jgi:hypothetical protein